MPSLPATALDRARRKAYLRLLPLLFLCYVIAYVDRTNVSLAKLTMSKDLPGFDNAVVGFGAGVFFLGYFVLEIPGTLLVEKWSARKWISRIMVSWGIVAALTALVRTPLQFYGVRFLLGLAEAGFFPGVIVYLTHWFPSRDRARALAWFFVATPIAQIISPKLSNFLLTIGTDETINGAVVHHPELMGMEGWQWMYIAWGIPAIVLGLLVLLLLTDRPSQAKWLDPEERTALEAELAQEKALHGSAHHHVLPEPSASTRIGRFLELLLACFVYFFTVLARVLKHPKVLLLALAYFFIVTGNYGVEFFLPSILERWYKLRLNELTWLVIIPPIGSLVGQLVVGWTSDYTKERRLHTAIPIYLGAIALASTLLSENRLWLTVTLFTVALLGLKAYLPAFWSLPSLLLSEAAAAASIGLINSVGNLGGQVGPYVLGKVESVTGSFKGGILFLCVSMAVSATIVMTLGLGSTDQVQQAQTEIVTDDAIVEPA